MEQLIKNRVGKPVTGDDFFDRVREQRSLWNRLDTDNVLLLAPRRVGKTSLMYRLRDTAEQHAFRAVYLSVAGERDELGFVRALYEAITTLENSTSVLDRIKAGPLGKLFKRIEVKKIGVSGLNVEFADREGAAGRWAELGQALNEALLALDNRCLLMVDELPIFVLSLMRQDSERARIFLDWFREMRLRDDSDHIRWLLAGSIGLDTVTARYNLQDTINDLFLFGLDAFSEADADAFLLGLSATYKLPLSDEVRKHILNRLGWPIPFFLNLVFSQLRDEDAQPITREAVDRAFEALMSPTKKAHFDYWRQRLHDELGQPEDGWALRLLGAIAKDPEGATRQSLGQLLREETNSELIPQERLTYLLDTFQSDGYTFYDQESSRHRFRSPLLREYWVRRGYA